MGLWGGYGLEQTGVGDMNKNTHARTAAPCSGSLALVSFLSPRRWEHRGHGGNLGMEKADAGMPTVRLARGLLLWELKVEPWPGSS